MNSARQIKPTYNTSKKALATAINAALISSLCIPVAMAQDQTGEADSEFIMEEVMVTATRRSMSLQDVPFNISAISGDYITQAGILDATELMRDIPGVTIADGGGRASETNANIMIRGINIDPNSTDRTYLSAPTVSVYIGDTPMYANFILRDVERVEVLRGPQATLYGSGSLGGTVRYIMNKPDTSGFEGNVGLDLSTTDGSSGNNWNGDFMLNIPMSETLAFRASGGRVDNAGIIDYVNAYQTDSNGVPLAEGGDILNGDPVYYNKKDADTVEVNFGRVALGWTPNDVFEAQLSYQFQEGDFGGRRQMTTVSNGYGVPYEKYQLGAVVLEPASNEAKMAALEMEYDMGFATLSSSSSYYDRSFDSISDNTGFFAAQELSWAPGRSWLYYYGYGGYRRPAASAFRTASEDAFVQEFRLASNTEDGAIDWVAGLYYMDQSGDATQNTFLPGFQEWRDVSGWANDFYGVSNTTFLWNYDKSFKDFAAFGEMTFHPTDTLDITVGARWFDNENTVTSSTALPIWIGSVFDFGYPAIESNTEKDSDMLFKGNIAWHINDNQMLYGTISEGYRRGGTNASPVWTPDCVRYCNDPSYSTFQSDSVINYEIGLKGSSDTMSYTVSAFYIDWSDPQLNTATPAGAFYAVVNGSEASSKGLDAELTWAITENLTFYGGYSYVDAKLDKDLYVPIGNPDAPAERLEASAGNQLPGTPENSVNLSLTHTFNLSNGWQWQNRGWVYWQDESENSILNSPDWNLTLGSFSLWNFSTMLLRDDWAVSLYIKNAFNEEGTTAEFKDGYFQTRPLDHFYGHGQKTFIAQPRTIGVSVRYWF